MRTANRKAVSAFLSSLLFPRGLAMEEGRQPDTSPSPIVEIYTTIEPTYMGPRTHSLYHGDRSHTEIDVLAFYCNNNLTYRYPLETTEENGDDYTTVEIRQLLPRDQLCSHLEESDIFVVGKVMGSPSLTKGLYEKILSQFKPANERVAIEFRTREGQLVVGYGAPFLILNSNCWTDMRINDSIDAPSPFPIDFAIKYNGEFVKSFDCQQFCEPKK